MSQKVRILISTYNGEKYFREQLESLINQTYPHIEIYIRDDGSTDGTVAIARLFASQYKNIKIFQEDNIGVINSFFSLLRCAVSEEIAFFAFCDQDDIWKPEKVERAVQKIKLEKEYASKPILYCSGYTLFNTKTHRKVDYAISLVRPSFNNAIVENIATGCTVVLNKRARDILISKKPIRALMHDDWSYLVISAFGLVIYDSYPSLFYRQHDSNVIGSSMTFRDKWNRKIRGYLQRRGIPLRSMQVNEFYCLFKDILDEEKKNLIRMFLSLRFTDRLRLVLGNCIYRQSTLDNIIFKLLYLLRKV